MMNRNIKDFLGKKVRHFKGGIYLVLYTAKHTETGENLVVYVSLNDHNKGQCFARPLDMFLSKVDKVKYPNATQEYRLELL